MFLQTLIYTIKHWNTTINSKEFTTFLLKINPEIHLRLHLILNCSPPPFLFPPILSLGPISLLPPVQSSPIGKTCPEDVQWRLVPHPSDLLCHPEQMGRVLYRSGHIGEMGESDSKRSLFHGTALSPRLCRSPNPFTILENPK